MSYRLGYRAWRTASVSTPYTRNSCRASTGSWDGGSSSWRTRPASMAFMRFMASTGSARARRPAPLPLLPPRRCCLSGAASPNALWAPRPPARPEAPVTRIGLQVAHPSRSPVSTTTRSLDLLNWERFFQ